MSGRPFGFGAGIWPVWRGELRTTSRRPFLYRLRLAGAIGGFALLSFLIFDSKRFGYSADVIGAQLFKGVHTLLLLLMVGAVPAFTADCIASERREGTLGLLFLTPLTATEIVLGKALAQIVKVFTLWLAVVPLLTIPFLTGGVGWNNVVDFLLIEVSTGIVCLAAGLLASSLTEKRTLAFVLAFALAATFLCGLGLISPGLDLNLVRRFQRMIFEERYGVLGLGYQYAWGGRFLSYAASGSPYLSYTPYPLSFRPPPVLVALSRPRLESGLLVALLILYGAIRFAGYCIKRSWKDAVPSVRRQRLASRYCTPIWGRWFAGRMQRALDRNPIAWLQQYSWKARLFKWGLCLVFLLAETAATRRADLRDSSDWMAILALILCAAYTFAGVNGFLNEKKTGALELILVTPLSVNQLIFGRVQGLWKQFLPAALLLAAYYIVAYPFLDRYYYFGFNFGHFFRPARSHFGYTAIAAFLTLPIFATCFALRFKSLFVASALTWAALLCGPLLSQNVYASDPWAGFAVTPILAYAAYSVAQAGLKRRIYAVQ